MVSISEKIEKKVYVKAGFTESQRTKNLEDASVKWANLGWAVIKRFDGGLTKTSYLMLEKNVSDQDLSNEVEERSVGVVLAIGIVILPIVFSWFTLRKGHTAASRIASFVWMIIPFAFLGMSGESNKNTSPVYNEDRVAPSVEEESVINNVSEMVLLPFTIEGFLERYNQSFRTLDHKVKVTIKNESDNGQSLAVQLKATSKNISLILGADNESRAVKSITLIGSGDGSSESGLDIMFASTAIVMAIENTDMPIDKRREIIDDLGFLKNITDNHSVVRHGVKYSSSYSEYIGFMLVVEPIQ